MATPWDRYAPQVMKGLKARHIEIAHRLKQNMPPCQGANRNGVYNITQGVAVGLGYWGLSALFGE